MNKAVRMNTPFQRKLVPVFTFLLLSIGKNVAAGSKNAQIRKDWVLEIVILPFGGIAALVGMTFISSGLLRRFEKDYR